MWRLMRRYPLVDKESYVLPETGSVEKALEAFGFRCFVLILGLIIFGVFCVFWCFRPIFVCLLYIVFWAFGLLVCVYLVFNQNVLLPKTKKIK